MPNTMLWANNASSSLAIPILSTSTTLTVLSGTGKLFPVIGTNQYFMATITDIVNNLLEIVQVNSVVGDTFYITRGQEGTTPQNFNAGVQIENRVTAGTLEYLANLAQTTSNSTTFTQTTPSTVWYITHNLNTYPNVTIYDANGNLAITDYNYTSLDTLTITFSIPMTGTVYLS